MNHRRILVTGANGFVGRALCAALLQHGFEVLAAVRDGNLNSVVPAVIVGEIDGQTDWGVALAGVDLVIHLGARVHVMHDKAVDPMAEFRRVNTAGTEHLARRAVASGVKRLVYVSSIGVNGLSTSGDTKFSEPDMPNPHNTYAVSKWEAEQALHSVAQETALEIVVVRPPLVYGAMAPGNFARMMQVVARGMPLPFGSVRNQRDFIYVGNLVDALIACATHPAAAGQTYLVSDGESISTPDLLRRLARAMAVPSRVFPFPPAMLRWVGKLLGKSAQIERLLGSLQVDSGRIRRELNWVPPYTLQQGLQATAFSYRTRKII